MDRSSAFTEAAAGASALGVSAEVTTLGDLSNLAEPDYRAKYAELAAQVRHLADDLDAMGKDWLQPWVVSGRLRALVGDWPHEVKP